MLWEKLERVLVLPHILRRGVKITCDPGLALDYRAPHESDPIQDIGAATVVTKVAAAGGVQQQWGVFWWQEGTTSSSRSGQRSGGGSGKPSFPPVVMGSRARRLQILQQATLPGFRKPTSSLVGQMEQLYRLVPACKLYVLRETDWKVVEAAVVLWDFFSAVALLRKLNGLIHCVGNYTDFKFVSNITCFAEIQILFWPTNSTHWCCHEMLNLARIWAINTLILYSLNIQSYPVIMYLLKVKLVCAGNKIDFAKRVPLYLLEHLPLSSVSKPATVILVFPILCGFMSAWVLYTIFILIWW